MDNQWEQVGVIGVDSGTCWIGDPGYCVTPDADEHPAETWGAFVDMLEQSGFHQKGSLQFNYKKGHPGLGVCVSQFGGDGEYPVLIRRNPAGLIAEVKVVFD